MNYRKALDSIYELSICIDCQASEIIEVMTGIMLDEEEAGRLKELMSEDVA